MENMNSSIFNKEIEFTNLPTRKFQVHMASAVNSSNIRYIETNT